MALRHSLPGVVTLLCLHAVALADMYSIDNPASRIRNPAGTMYNPAAQVNNPAANIYNPAGRMNSPDPLSPPTQPLPDAVPDKTAGSEKSHAVPRPSDRKLPPRLTAAVPWKEYNFRTVGEYITAAKKAFNRDDYTGFVAITEDALRRIKSGTLKSSGKTRKKLARYRAAGYALIEADE